MTPSLDTVQVHLQGWSIPSAHKLRVKLGEEDGATGEVLGIHRLWGNVWGSTAYFNAPENVYSVEVKPHYGKIRAFVHLSVPRFYQGENFHSLAPEDARRALFSLGERIADLGIETDLMSANLSRVDVAKTVHLDEDFAHYKPIFSALHAKRMNEKVEYTGGYLYRNTQGQASFYDQGLNFDAKDIPRPADMPGGYRNGRGELRLLNHRKIGATCKVQTVGDLVQRLDDLPDMYRRFMSEQVFKTEIEERMRMRDPLCSSWANAKRRGGRLWQVEAWVEYAMLQAVQNNRSIDNVVDLLRPYFTGKNPRQDIMRMRKRIERIALNTGAGKIPDLYNELRYKLAS